MYGEFDGGPATPGEDAETTGCRGLMHMRQVVETDRGRRRFRRGDLFGRGDGTITGLSGRISWDDTILILIAL